MRHLHTCGLVHDCQRVPLPGADTFIDGLGVVDDYALPTGTRIRLRPTGDPSEDITVEVSEGHVNVMGMNRPVVVKPHEKNWVTVHAGRWDEH